MRSKCRRYSSSSASRSPCWPRSTSRRTCSFEPLAGFAAARVASSAITLEMPPAARRLTRSRRPEADPALPGEALHVHDPLEGDRVAAVLRIESEGRLARAGTEVGRAQRLLQRVCTGRRDQRAHDLAAVEGDL